MSMLQTVKIKLGGAVDKFKNFIFDASRLDGVFDLKRESGETILSIDANNNLNIPGYIFPGMMQVGNNDSDDNNFVFDATADDGTMKLARESGQDIMTVDAAGKVAFPQNLSPLFIGFVGSVRLLTTNLYEIIYFDTVANVDGIAISNSRFKPSVAGYYDVSCSLRGVAATTMSSLTTSIYKNGSIYKLHAIDAPGITLFSEVNSLVYLNGTTDYVEIFARVIGTGTLLIEAGETNSFLSISLARRA